MVTRKDAIVRIKNLVAELKSAGYNPTQVYLFGSVAKGTTHQWSDIDVAIWDNKFTGIRPTDLEPILNIKRKYPLLELHTFTASETVEENPFIGEIIAHGIPIII